MNASTQASTVPAGWWNRMLGRRRSARFDVDAALQWFAAAAERTLGMTPFDGQLESARRLAQGRAVEMRTGEGKTLAVAASAAASALAGRHVHVATVNQYLAERDFATFAPVLRHLGLTVGLIADNSPPATNRKAYDSQIVYATGYALGFDYLRDQQRLAQRNSAQLGDALLRRLAGEPDFDTSPMRLDFVILDEADSVLLDEATVPLLLGEPAPRPIDDAATIELAAKAIAELHFGPDFIVDTQNRTAALTSRGKKTIDAWFASHSDAVLLRPWRQYVEHALFAEQVLRREIDYVVAADRIRLVDLTTGRIFDDRRWPEGLQQALEWKERLPFSEPTVGAASITRARFFRSYRTLSGISGTLNEAATELRSAFGLTVDTIAPRLPSRLVELPTRTFASADARRRAVALEADTMRRRGRPVLVGCRTIAESSDISREFVLRDIPHRLLDGRQTAAEATVVAEAGHSGIVTIATNMAGRGTDIRLDDTAKEQGGLHVIGVERNDSTRIDRQLLGRAGRQGDPGSGRFFVAATDGLIANEPRFVATLLENADEQGEVHGNFEAPWTDAVRSAELATRRRREDAERGQARRAAATLTLLR